MTHHPTLADMTPEGREQCVGMWCDTPEELSVFFENKPDWGPPYIAFAHPSKPYVLTHLCGWDKITPRPDLPRAWNPDGTPAQKEEA